MRHFNLCFLRTPLFLIFFVFNISMPQAHAQSTPMTDYPQSAQEQNKQAFLLQKQLQSIRQKQKNQVETLRQINKKITVQEESVRSAKQRFAILDVRIGTTQEAFRNMQERSLKDPYISVEKERLAYLKALEDSNKKRRQADKELSTAQDTLATLYRRKKEAQKQNQQMINDIKQLITKLSKVQEDVFLPVVAW
ncbi:MAG: hypothetical protein H7832_07100 [Magnetococcus sp. DMHC-6]